ncbi:MAG: alpha/beta hydrolase [Cyanobacteria bacterium P01_C01_bin.38]
MMGSGGAGEISSSLATTTNYQLPTTNYQCPMPHAQLPFSIVH